MPLREKFRRAFRRASSSSTSTPPSPPSLPLTPTNTRTSKKSSKKQPAPSTEHPPPKYRGPVNPAHAATLRAFSFGATGAGRRRSGQSQYSPRGSRVPSRMGSVGVGRGSVEAGDGVKETEGDDDVGNVGLSRQHTASTVQANEEARPLAAAADPMMRAGQAGRTGANGGGGGRLFSEEELARAMTRCELRV